MNKRTKSAGFFGLANVPGWKARLAKMGIVPKTQQAGKAKLEIDDANGETMVFPEIGDVSEIVEGVTVTAEDGDHVFTADDSIYTVTVENGVVTKVIEDQTNTETEEEVAARVAAEAAAKEAGINAATFEAFQEIANELEANAQFRTATAKQISDLSAENVKLKKELADAKALMSHDGDGGNGGADDKELIINGKKIDFNKLNR